MTSSYIPIPHTSPAGTSASTTTSLGKLSGMIEAVVFDMDGVIVDSEERWEAVRRQLVLDAGRPYPEEATRKMQGMSAPEWEAYLHEELGVPGTPVEIGRRVVAQIEPSRSSSTAVTLIPSTDGSRSRVRALIRSPVSRATPEVVPIHSPPWRSRVSAVMLGDGNGAFNNAGCDLGKVAIWAFHGDADGTVSPNGSINPIENLNECDSPAPVEAKLTIYPGVGHNSWDRTYDGSAGHDIYGWLLGHSKQ